MTTRFHAYFRDDQDRIGKIKFTYIHVNMRMGNLNHHRRMRLKREHVTLSNSGIRDPTEKEVTIFRT